MPAPTVQDHVALAEIELCGELMIAASAAVGERLSPDRIDEVLKAAPEAASECPGALGRRQHHCERDQAERRRACLPDTGCRR